MESKMYEEMAAMEGSHWWFLGRRAVVLDLISRFAPSHGKLLDIGLGTGYNANIMSKQGFDVVGVEPSKDAIAFAKKTAPQVSVIESPFPSNAIPSDTYDVALLLDVVEHLEDDGAALRDLKRVLKPGGVAFITVPAFMFLWTAHDKKAHHFRRYTKAELLRVIREADLKPTFVSYYNFFLFPAIAALRILGKMLGRSEEGSDFDVTPRFLNGFLASLFSSEKWLLRVTSLPFGVSLVAFVKKI